MLKAVPAVGLGHWLTTSQAVAAQETVEGHPPKWDLGTELLLSQPV